MKIAIVNKENLTIASRYEADAPSQGAYGGPWSNPELFAHIGIPSELDEYLVEAKLENGQIVLFVDAAKLAAKQQQEAIAATIAEGKKARAACEEVLSYVTGYNVSRAFTAEQVTSFQSTFADIFNLLLSGRPNSAKLAIDLVLVDGTIVTDELKSNALAILANYGF